MKRNDLTGKSIGRLAIVQYVETRKNRAYWLCQCTCGNTTIVSSSNLRPTAKSAVRSCGCLHKEAVAKMGRATRKHGEAVTRTPEYTAWRNIRVRCYNENAPNKKYYSEMGVNVCDRWLESFDNFLADMGRRPSSRHSIDRYPNPSGDYEPSNCRWATALEQRHNRRQPKG